MIGSTYLKSIMIAAKEFFESLFELPRDAKTA
jgi:hypothetical protein